MDDWAVDKEAAGGGAESLRLVKEFGEKVRRSKAHETKIKSTYANTTPTHIDDSRNGILGPAFQGKVRLKSNMPLNAWVDLHLYEKDWYRDFTFSALSQTSSYPAVLRE